MSRFPIYEPSDRLLSQLERHEGFRPTVYLCPTGHRTIGYGHNLDANPLPDIDKHDPHTAVSRAQARDILARDVACVAAELDHYLPWWRDVEPEARRDVLVNMAFNLGVKGLMGFRTTLSFLRNGDYLSAAAHMLDSKWAHQVGRRAKELADQMEWGLYADK